MFVALFNNQECCITETALLSYALSGHLNTTNETEKPYIDSSNYYDSHTLNNFDKLNFSCLPPMKKLNKIQKLLALNK